MNSPLHIAVEKRLRLLHDGRHPLHLETVLPDARLRGLMLAYLGAGLAAINTGRVTLAEASAAGWGVTLDGQDTRAGAMIRRRCYLLLRLVIKGVELRGEA
jgi:hypothetical protein